MATEADLKKKIRQLEAESKKLQKIADKSTDSYKQQVRELKNTTKEIRKKIKLSRIANQIDADAEKRLKEMLKSQERINSNLAATLSFNKQIRETFGGHMKDMTTYLGSVGAWFTKGEEIARNYNEIAKSIGLSKRQTLGLSQEFRGAVAQVMRMGGELGDITDIGQEFAEATGRQRIVSAEDVIRIEKISKGANLYASEASKLFEAFDFMGISGEKTYEI